MKQLVGVGKETATSFQHSAAQCKTPLSVENRISALLAAPPETLAAIDSILTGDAPKRQSPSLRLLRVGEAATATKRSRWLIWRAIRAGHIRTVRLHPDGVNLIPESELLKLVEGGGL